MSDKPLTAEEMNLLEGAARQQFLNYALLYILETEGPKTIPHEHLGPDCKYAGVQVTQVDDTESELTVVTHEQLTAMAQSTRHNKH